MHILRNARLAAYFLLAWAVLSPGAAVAASSNAQVSVEQAWVRAPVAGQRSTGAFMRITARQQLRLVRISTPVAAVAEVHEMRMDGDVMRMRPIDGIDLPAGRAFELKPGGHHLMLQELKAPIVAGGTVPLTLHLRDTRGVETRLDLQVPVAGHAPAGAAPAHSHHKH